MQEQNNDTPEPIKPDLKHDTMEYAASTDGDDILDSDKESADQLEEEEISPEELELLEGDAVDEQAAALITAETDSLADEDNFLHVAGDEDEIEEDIESDEDTDDEEDERR